ncbi:MAG: response regulator [Bacteriovoracaceae bacterium]|nr:response regulator [Bacteroidota bacterium]
MTSGISILIVDDEVQMRRLLRTTLENDGYKITVAENGSDAIRLSESNRFDLVILDLGLPDVDGREVLKKIRSWARYPILILSARSDEQDIISALDAGANDYLTKPFRGGELIARVRTALRIFNSTSQKESKFTFGTIAVDLDAHTISKNNDPVKLTPTEFSLLALFIRNEGKVLTHNYILQQVWGPKFEGESQYTRVYVGQLRKKLEDDSNNPVFFLTESGIGYRFSDELGQS